ncbi:TonB-dependent receptor [Aliarcobacter vitoriensis]|uniref:TonB-dependent siderophore receptor n=1 Tax=Aliarcobacter vitoriensis TaxID=2011099 RepID=A0A366MRB8_9BACT|nr:TonB-dependent receptor [Aliarcobacter vitoriensis]RBQ28150.1 TonB-dependent siderophore receptor [Aliarcobacter vitoriensis]
MLKSKKILFLSLVTSSLLFAEETTKLEEITVSANKMEENIQDVPQSISVISKEDIEQKGFKNIKDVINEIPNMHIDGINQVSFRGLNISNLTTNNPVVIYLDGVPYYSMYDFNASIANVEQIEVLRGAQGTLYGKDAIGGVINIITKSPTNEWKGIIQTEYGNDNTFNAKLNTSGAIIDNKLFAGINGSFNHTDGWIENHYADIDKHANKSNDRKTSGFLLYKPTDNLSAKLTVADDYNKFYDSTFQVPLSKSVNSISRDDGKNANYDVPSYQQMESKSQALNFTYELEKLKFESITTHKKNEMNSQYDLDINTDDKSYSYNSTDTETYTQEFRLSSKNQDIKWLTGIYVDKQDRDTNMGADSDFFTMKSPSSTTDKTYAFFGQTMIPLGKSFELTLGGRYQKIKSDIDLISNTSMMGMNLPSFNYSDEKTWNSFLPKAALTYKINDNLSTYISFSKGYISGGFNTAAQFGSTNENMFEPQKSTNYEVGAKYIGNNFALNAAIFRMDIKDTQVFYYLPTNETITDNAKKSHSQGIEIDGTYFITDNWSISGAVGLIQAKYDEYSDGRAKYDGQKIQNTPKYTANLGISYLADSGIYGRVDFNARGKTNFFDNANTKMVETNGAFITNVKVGYKVGDFDIYAFAKNLTNEDYIDYYSSYGTTSTILLNEPRQFGIGAIYKF